MFVALAETSSDLIGICDPEGNVRYVNEAGRSLLDIGSLEDAQQTNLVNYFSASDLDYVTEEIIPALNRDGRWVGDVRFKNFRTGDSIPVNYNVFALADTTGKTTALATVSRDLRRRIRVESGLRLLSRTGAAIDSLEIAETLRSVAQAFVPEFASFCVIDSFADAMWQRTVVHSDESKAHLLRSLSRPSANNPVSRAIERGDSSLRTIDDAWLREIGIERADALRALGARSLLTVPVVTSNGEIVGALTCGREDGHPSAHLGQDDLPFVEEAARRAGSAITNARLYERERRVAVELQAASLPATLPHIEQLRISAAYRPGSAEARIGGDWYDAFALTDGRIALTVGDVLGHGLHAAITMTKLRQSMQSAAMIDPDPNVMLTVADKPLRLIDPDCYATAIAAIYDGRRHTLTFASAGHPGPVVRTEDGAILEYSSPGTMLGLRRGDEANVTVIASPPGCSVVFFTDGLVEATRDMQMGQDRLREAVSVDDVLFDSEPAKAIVQYVLGPIQANDDIAVLVVQPVRPAEPVAFAETQGTDREPDARGDRGDANRAFNDGVSRSMSWTFESHDAEAARALRHSFAAYAANVVSGEHELDTSAAELVIGELIGNVKQHAPGSVNVHAQWQRDRVSITVTSEGPSFTLPTSAPEDPLSESGRGLFLVRSHTSDLRVSTAIRGRCQVRAVIPLAVPETP